MHPTLAGLQKTVTAALERFGRALWGRIDVVVLAAVVLVYVLVRAKSPFESIGGDGHYTWLWARSLAFDHDLSLDNDFRVCGDPWARGRGPTGHAVDQWPMGPAVFWAPAALVAKALLAAPPRATASLLAACRGPWADAAMYGTVLAGALTLVLAWRVLRRHVDALPAAVGLVVGGLASPLMHYTVYSPSYSHAHAAFGVALFVERWDAWRARPTALRVALLGLCLGLAMLMRPQSFALVLLPLADSVATLARGDHRRDPRAWGRVALGWAIMGAAALVVFAPQFWAWKYMYGKLFVVPQGPRYMRWTHPHFTGLLFSTYNGLLVTTPMLYPGFVGLLALPFWKRHRALAPLTVLLLAVWYVNASVWDYWGEASFSARRMTELTAPFAVATGLVVAALVRFAERRPRAMAALGLAPVLLFGVAWNLGAMRGTANGRTFNWGERLSPEVWNPTFDVAFTGLWEAVGNPLSWPASIPWAIRYRAHPRFYDRIVGVGYFKHRYTDGRPEQDHFPFGNWNEFFPDGFSDVVDLPVTGRGRIVARHGRAIVPLFANAMTQIVLTAQSTRDAPSRVTVRWNGTVLGTATFQRAPSDHTFTPPPGVVKVWENEVEFDVTGAPVGLHRMRFVSPPTPPARF